MKLKLKLDKKAIQNFLLQNVEKIVLGLVVIIFLLMLSSAWSGAKSYEKSPEELQRKVDDGKRAMDKTKFEDYVKEKSPTAAPTDTATAQPAEGATTTVDNGLVVIDYVSMAKRSRVPIEEKPYRNSVAWDEPLFPRQSLRVEPSLFTVQELRGTAGMGAFQVTTTPAGEAVPAAQPPRNTPRNATTPMVPAAGMTTGGQDLRGKRWIVLTALVPVEKQETAYADAFKQASGYDPQADHPMYGGYLVQRVELAGASDAANIDWSKVPEISWYNATEAATKDWGPSRGADVVSLEYLDQQLAFPLGPLMNRAWDASVAHEPEIPALKFDAPGGRPRHAGTRHDGTRNNGARNNGTGHGCASWKHDWGPTTQSSRRRSSRRSRSFWKTYRQSRGRTPQNGRSRQSHFCAKDHDL